MTTNTEAPTPPAGFGPATALRDLVATTTESFLLAVFGAAALNAETTHEVLSTSWRLAEPVAFPRPDGTVMAAQVITTERRFYLTEDGTEEREQSATAHAYVVDPATDGNPAEGGRRHRIALPDVIVDLLDPENADPDETDETGPDTQPDEVATDSVNGQSIRGAVIHLGGGRVLGTIPAAALSARHGAGCPCN